MWSKGNGSIGFINLNKKENPVKITFKIQSVKDSKILIKLNKVLTSITQKK